MRKLLRKTELLGSFLALFCAFFVLFSNLPHISSVYQLSISASSSCKTRQDKTRQDKTRKHIDHLSLLSAFPMCLSGACLGETIVFSAIKWYRTRRYNIDMRRCLTCSAKWLHENGTFYEFFPCLSRACLGKMTAFVYKWLKKCRFLTWCVR